MPEPFDVTCSICGTPMLPNLSQEDAEECLAGIDPGSRGLLTTDKF